MTTPAIANAQELPRPGAPVIHPAQAAWRSIRRHPLALAGVVWLTFLALMALFYPLVSHYTYYRPTEDYSAGSSAQHWLGTDDSGYDTLTRLCVGARISLYVGIGVEVIVVFVGGLVGLIAGYYGRWTDTWLMRFTDIMFAFPDILLAMLIMAVSGPSLGNIFLALGVTGWPGLARLVRAQAISLRGREFIEASRAIGLTDRQIILRHILPNLLSAVVVASAIDIAGVIIAESTLSFLGIGVQSPMPSWGSMISGAWSSGYGRSHPALIIYPALCLSLTVLSLNFIGDALRDALDPRSKG
ncbi:glutathione ABC transporter permease GsiD [Capsulimonas corticalis]|uniref:Glutathione ABC transporter permease GsiD n=1 Tax=Capsulimonas corticalis TaxID=2219043 RepID=A0A402CX49_9BACT|nr:ABC transporter permease [Capsulimonas corticalis]BDI34343.1 glutathione ABC transporter permease GsiD [Capsulimonas corticalis]